MIRFNFEKIDPALEHSLPTRATEHSAGYDIFSPTDVDIAPMSGKTIPLNISWDPTLLIQMNLFAKVYDKSGLANRFLFTTLAGVIDLDYCRSKVYDPKEVEWKLICYNLGNHEFNLVAGKAICQFVVCPFIVEQGDKTVAQRIGGLGSTKV